MNAITHGIGVIFSLVGTATLRADLDGDGDRTEEVPFDLAGQARRVDDPLVPDTGAGPAPAVDHGAFERQ